LQTSQVTAIEVADLAGLSPLQVAALSFAPHRAVEGEGVEQSPRRSVPVNGETA
jgi:hypothetical protein